MQIIDDKNEFYKIDGELMALLIRITNNIDNEEILEVYANCGRLTEKFKNTEITEIK